MASFRSSKGQAKKLLQDKVELGVSRHQNKSDGKSHGSRTSNHYEDSLVIAADWLKANQNMTGLHHMTSDQAQAFLFDRAEYVGQKQLQNDKRALEVALSVKLDHVKSLSETSLKSRAYTKDQVKLISQAQRGHNSILTEISHEAGLRAHEFFTLRRLDERGPAPYRDWSENRFTGRSGILYTVKGKGGLVRAVMIPFDLAAQLEKLRLDKPRDVYDRGVHYKQQCYDIGGGQSWSQSFSSASKRALGWSNGAHGLRFSYAQARMDKLQNSMSYYEALEIVSQELGHFRPEITKVYLR